MSRVENGPLLLAPLSRTWVAPLGRSVTAFLFLVVLAAACSDNSQNSSGTSSDTTSNLHQPATTDQHAAGASTRRTLGGDVVIDVSIIDLPGGLIRVHGTTNLPTNTKLMLSVGERIKGGYFVYSECFVASDGSFNSEPLGSSGGFKDGLYIAEVLMPIPRAQPSDVKKIIGENGENLSGPLVINGEYGITVASTKEFSIGGAQAALAQQQRVKETEKSIAKFKFDICVQLERLLSFKDKLDFKAYGFAVGKPYHKWLTDVESLKGKALRDSQLKNAPLVLQAAPGDLSMIGMEYMQMQRETEYTRQMMPELQETIGYADYLATKSQRRLPISNTKVDKYVFDEM